MCLLVLAVHHPVLGQSSGEPYGERCKALSTYTTDHPQCTAFGYCQEVECISDLIGALSVLSCEDPVQVKLRVVADSFDRLYMFTVTEDQGHCETGLPVDGHLYTTYSRNVSHLQFQVRANRNSD